MIETIEELKESRPDLVELFESMDREQLLNQCYLESMDAINMEKRVEVFMEHCTVNMSKTNYTEASLKSLISDKQELDIDEFCYYETCDGQSDEEILSSIKERAKVIEEKNEKFTS